MPVEFRAMISFPARQRGIASLMVILLTGMTLTIAALGMMYMVQGTQERQLAVHATTPAQLKAWTGVELLRQFLTNRSTNDLEALAAGEIAVGGTTGIKVELLSKTKPQSGQYRIVANVTGRAADSTAIVQAVYNVKPLDYITTAPGTSTGSTSPAPVNTPATVPPLIRTSTDLNLGSGTLIFTGPQEANVSVNGKVNLSGNVQGLDAISATDDIVIGGTTSMSALTTSGNITLNDAASALTVRAMKNVTLNDSASSANVTANGTITLNGFRQASLATAAGLVKTTAVSVANALGTVTVKSGAVSTINTQADIVWTSSEASRALNANGRVIYSGSNNGTVINNQGDVQLTSATVQAVKTQGSTTLDTSTIANRLDGRGSLDARNRSAVSAGIVGGSITADPNSKSRINVISTAGYSVAVPAVTVTAVTAPTSAQVSKVDAYALRSSANYEFEMVGTQRKVTVRNVQGIADGTYYLGNYPSTLLRGYRDYLCTAVGSDGFCTVPAQPNRTLCQGETSFNGCITYQQGTWYLGGRTLAPGVLWFKGNLDAGSGVYYNSMIATGNIRTSGRNKTVAVNYAGYGPVCTAVARQEDGLAISNDLKGLFPRNLCDTAAGTYKLSAEGNLAFLAGSYEGGSFVGGTITLGSNLDLFVNDVYGSVVAGNNVVTNSTTRVHGTLTSASQGGATQQMGGTTTIDTSGWPATYSPEQAPGNTPAGTGGMTNGSMYDGRPGPTVEMVWTRYL
ncbi:FapA family protein [Pseudomonas sp. MAG002Y]|uniref:FapA family protein n=1 Tax=Pseudomonas sp. MAG002Y TaxID=2678690 RepID=UPI001C60B69D|nr:FapA family protein [Pseudomonas sp. MAG002Y]MBW5414423.1 hypothetical protein [Pseudomonas sp. MAG002Y]